MVLCQSILRLQNNTLDLKPFLLNSSYPNVERTYYGVIQFQTNFDSCNSAKILRICQSKIIWVGKCWPMMSYLGRMFYHYVLIKIIFYYHIFLQFFYMWFMGGWVLEFYSIVLRTCGKLSIILNNFECMFRANLFFLANTPMLT